MLYIFDLDETLVRPIAGVKVPNKLTHQEMIPGVAAKCAELRSAGHTLAIASNQGGVAFGLCTLDEAGERICVAGEVVGASYSVMSLYHEKGTFPVVQYRGMGVYGVAVMVTPIYRKPQPGMLLWLMLRAETAPADVIFIGDQDSDHEAAKNAGVRFAFASKFFK